MQNELIRQRPGKMGWWARQVLLSFFLTLIGPVSATTSSSVSAEFPIDTGGRLPHVARGESDLVVISTRGSSVFASAPSAYLTIDTRTAGETFAVQAWAFVPGEPSPAGVQVEVRQNGTLIATAETDSFGFARVMGVSAGFYEVRALKSGYLSRPLPHLRVPEDTREPLNFLLTPRPGVPPLVASGTQPEDSLVRDAVHPPGSHLKVWVNDAFQPAVSLDANRLTIVLTHGCISSSDQWPTAMAGALSDRGRQDVNIVAWDWRGAAFNESATTCDCDLAMSALCSRPRNNARDEGLMLGQALWEKLRGGYDRPIHFLGHSLGNFVNAVAADYLHGDYSPRPPQAWPWTRTHVTVFDHAGLLPEFRLGESDLGWVSPIPKRAAFVDNYVTFSGVVLNEPGHNIVNTFLQRSRSLNPVDLHKRPYEWYIETIRTPGSSDLGFRDSFEFRGDSARFAVPDRYRSGAIFVQNEDSPNEQALIPLPQVEGLLRRTELEVAARFGIGGAYIVRARRTGVVIATTVVDGVVSAAGKAARKIGDVTVAVGETVLDHYGGSLNPFNDPIFGIGQTTPAILAIPGLKEELSPVASWSLELTLKTLPLLQFPFEENPEQIRALSSHTTNSPAYVWLPLHVPSDAIALAFDFTVSGDVAQDRIVAGINTSNLFNLSAQSLPTNAPMNTGPLPISGWAGEEIELFIGLAGGTSTNAVLTVNSIRFLSLPLPVLQVEKSGPEVVLSWTEASPGFVLEQSASLAPGSWTRVENVSGYPGQRWFTNSVPAASAFFRLRQAAE